MANDYGQRGLGEVVRIINCRRFWNFAGLTDKQIIDLMDEVWGGTLGGARLDEAAIRLFMGDIATELRKRGHSVGWRRHGGASYLIMDNHLD